MDTKAKIIKEIKRGASIVIVGPSNSGKTFWIKNYLLPEILKFGKKINYFEDGFSKNLPSLDISIFDEVETFFDATMLQNKNPEEKPYYTEKYIVNVKLWYELYKEHPEQSIYIISRQKSDIPFLIKNFNKTDWYNRDIKVFEFPHLNF